MQKSRIIIFFIEDNLGKFEFTWISLKLFMSIFQEISIECQENGQSSKYIKVAGWPFYTSIKT